MSTRQLDQAVFGAVLPEDVDWQPFPSFPPAARLAVVVGDPAQAAPYVVRVRLPSGVRLMPHRHREDRVYTVMSGVFYIGVGERFDDGRLQAYPPGAVIVLPGGTPHFHWAKSGEYVTQVTAFGPISLEYLDPENDPRNSRGPGWRTRRMSTRTCGTRAQSDERVSVGLVQQWRPWSPLLHHNDDLAFS